MNNNSREDNDYPSLSDINVIIPTLNEEQGIGRVLDELSELGVPLRNVIVVDGNSVDRTREIAREKGAVVVIQEGRGKADAIKTGIRHADKDYVLVMDGDCTYPPSEIPRLLQACAEKSCDEVIGARLNGKENIPALHRFGNKLLTMFFNALFGTGLKDVLSGMYLVKKDSLVGALFEFRGFSVESEIAAHIAGTGGRVCEVPITYKKRCGEAKLRALHGFNIALDMLRLSWRYNPASTIFIIGVVILIPGLILGAYAGYHYFFTGIKYYVKGLAAIIMTLTGLMSISLGILSLYLKRLEFRLIALQRRLIENKEKAE